MSLFHLRVPVINFVSAATCVNNRASVTVVAV
jgi:hypothetical protein